MLRKCTLALAQYPITFFQDWAMYEKHVERWINEALPADIAVFPEYGSMELVSLLPIEIRNDLHEQILAMQQFLPDFLELYARLARKTGCILVAPSFPVQEKGKMVNRVHVFGSKGLAGYQDKHFMTRFENEDWSISPGEYAYTLFEAVWGTFGIQICYDVEFAIGSKKLAENGAQLILAPSCTETIRGANRVHVGARARAMENQCYVGVSQTILHSEWSLAVDINYGFAGVYATPDIGFPEDGMLSQGIHNKAKWHKQELDFSLIDQVRKKGSVFNFADHGLIRSELIHNNPALIRKIKL